MAAALRPELETLPHRMRSLPVDERGYPVPWFVAWLDGKPEFRGLDSRKWSRAVKERLCWVCGEPLGKWMTFVIGPMCGINRISSEPPSHRDCAQWSARNCPFLSRPHMIRRENNLPEEAEPAGGISIPRNPGVSLLWTTLSYEVVSDRQNPPKQLIVVGDPESIEWWYQGRLATRAEVEHSVETGYPLLVNVEQKARERLALNRAWLERQYPREETTTCR